jgi:hypothetical protein
MLLCQSEGLAPEDAVLVIQRYYRNWRHGGKLSSQQQYHRTSSRPAPSHQPQANRQAELISFSNNVSHFVVPLIAFRKYAVKHTFMVSHSAFSNILCKEAAKRIIRFINEAPL